jgi:hypothetical protein
MLSSGPQPEHYVLSEGREMADWLIVLFLLGEVAVVMMTAFLFAPVLGFIPLYAESIVAWAIGLPVFWLGGW